MGSPSQSNSKEKKWPDQVARPSGLHPALERVMLAFQSQAVFRGTRKLSPQCPKRSQVHELRTVCGTILLLF